MKTMFFASMVTLTLISQANASIPAKVASAALKMSSSQVRTLILETHQSNACDAGYNIEIQVNLAERMSEDGQIAHHWQTVKVVNSNSDGEIMEICEE